jgi:hypothetical protein
VTPNNNKKKVKNCLYLKTEIKKKYCFWICTPVYSPRIKIKKKKKMTSKADMDVVTKAPP